MTCGKWQAAQQPFPAGISATLQSQTSQLTNPTQEEQIPTNSAPAPAAAESDDEDLEIPAAPDADALLAEQMVREMQQRQTEKRGQLTSSFYLLPWIWTDSVPNLNLNSGEGISGDGSNKKVAVRPQKKRTKKQEVRHWCEEEGRRHFHSSTSAGGN